MNIAISAESTIDLTPALLKEYEISTVPFNLILGEKQGRDGEITPQEIFEFVDKTKKLPRTAAINAYQYSEYFQEVLKTHDHVIHFSLSSGLSASYANAVAAAKTPELKGKVDVIDTLSLSTGIALQAIYARKLARAGKTPEEIVSSVLPRIPFDQTSFSLESVNYLYKGGRCSALAMIGANLLKLKPEIYVKDGKMGPGAKYRGPMMKVVLQYVEDTLKEFNNPDKEIVFITYSSAPADVVEAVRQRLQKEGFVHIHETTAGGTITCHCGPHCLGILYMNDGPHPID